MTPETQAIIDFDVEAVVKLAVVIPPGLVKRNRAAARRYFRDAARRGERGKNDEGEALLWRFRRDVLREAGVDERLVRLVGV